MVDKKEVQDEILKHYDNVPEYNGESLVELKEKIRNIYQIRKWRPFYDQKWSVRTCQLTKERNEEINGRKK